MTRTSLLLAVAAASFLPHAAAAQQKFDDAYIQQLINSAAAKAGVGQATGTQTPSTPQAPGGQQGPAVPPGGSIATAPPPPAMRTVGAGPVVDLTLDDAIKLALDRNLDISVQRLNPETYEYSVAGLQAFYKPTLTSTLNTQSFANPSTNTVNGAAAGTAITTDTSNWNGGLTQNFRWGGGNATVLLNNSRQTSDNPTRFYSVQYSPNWSFAYNQPLMRGFKIDNTRQQLVITRLNQDISEIQLQALIINTVSNVRNAYWDYVYATQSVQVAQRSVEIADQLVRDNQTRVEIGTMAPIDVVQAQSQAATQRQNMAQAEGTRRTAELALKRLIVNGTQDSNWNSTLNPTDRAEFVPTEIDIPAAVRRALENRTDLQQARKNLQVNDTTVKYLHNTTLPQVDLNARYGLVGQGGTQIVYEGTGITRVPVGQIPGGYSNALNTLFNNSYPQWNVSLNLSYPLGTSSADANVARAQVQLRQVDAQLKQIELQIATEVTNAATQVMNNVERVQAAQAAREFAQKQLEAEQSKFEVGMSTNYFVVQAQRDLATAFNNELSAVLAYRRSQVELERLQQTSLSTSNITIVGR